MVGRAPQVWYMAANSEIDVLEYICAPPGCTGEFLHETAAEAANALTPGEAVYAFTFDSSPMAAEPLFSFEDVQRVEDALCLAGRRASWRDAAIVALAAGAGDEPGIAVAGMDGGS